MSKGHFLQELISQIVSANKMALLENDGDILTKVNLEEKNILISDIPLTNADLAEVLPIVEIAEEQGIIGSNFLKAPVDYKFLITKLNFVANSFNGSNKRVILSDQIVLLPSKKQIVIIEGKKSFSLDITQKESDLLLYLAENSNGVSKDDLQQKVFGYNSEVDSHTVETHIYRIKNKHNLMKGLIILNGKGVYKLSK